jgi:lipoyl(octanoyl) transferase
VRVVDLGLNVPYDEGMRVMHDAMARVDEDGPVLLLLEHAPVLTVTRRGGLSAFISPRERVEQDGIELKETDRGGDATFHGPGQIVGYPILRLGPTSLGSDVVGYVHALEACVMRACQALGVKDAHTKSERDEAGHHLTGVWCRAPVVSSISCGLNDVQWQDAKVCALGVGLAGGVTRHGFALNVDIDLEKYLQHIVPCGLTGRTATSLERVLSKTPPRQAVKDALVTELMSIAARHRVLPRAAHPA